MSFLDVLFCTTVPPSQPISIFIQSMGVGLTFARICWQPPSFRGIPTVSRYLITVTPVDGGADSLTFSTNNSTRDFNVTGLVPGTRYEFRVAAISEYEGIIGRIPESDPVFTNTTYTGKASVSFRNAFMCICTSSNLSSL